MYDLPSILLIRLLGIEMTIWCAMRFMLGTVCEAREFAAAGGLPRNWLRRL